MNDFILKLTKGEDKILPIYLRDEDSGLAIDLSPAGVTVGVIFESGSIQVIVPSTDIIFQTTTLLKNEIHVLLNSVFTNTLQVGVYDARVTVSIPTLAFPSGFMRNVYLVRRVIQVE